MRKLAALAIVAMLAGAMGTAASSASIASLITQPATRPATPPATQPSNQPSTQPPAPASGRAVTRPARMAATRPALILLKAPDSPRAVILHLPGIGGLLRMDRALAAGLLDGHKDQPFRVQVYNWPAYDLGMGALLNLERNRAEAKIVARHILRIRRDYPDLPLYITSHSGGTGVLMWALEELPPEVTVDQVFLLAPALSPAFDLSPALAHVRGKCYVLSSRLDPVLPMCKAFGTIDRVHTAAAGLEGFVQPRQAKDPAQYGKLVPMPYQDDWMNLENLGDHIGPLQRAFATRVLAPLLKPAPEAKADNGPTADPR